MGSPARKPRRPARTKPPRLRVVTSSRARASRSDQLLERRENSLLSLFELSGELSLLRDPFAMAQLTTLNAIGHFGTRCAALWAFPDDSAAAPVALCAYGLQAAELRPLGAALALTGSGPGQPIPMPDAEAAAILAVAVPVETHDRRLGVMALGPRLDGEPYQPLDVEYLMTGGRMLAVALDNARLVHHMAESNRELRRANRMLTDLDGLRSQFVQNVNHEMRTPITIIKGYLQTLAGAGAQGFERRALDAMLQQTDRLTRMVEDLLDYSALTERGVEMASARVAVAALVERLATERRPGVLAGWRLFEMEQAGGLPDAIADAARLERVLDELIDNAVKFTPAGTRIGMRTRHEPGVALPIVIEVEDDGPGIAPDQLGSVFDPFRQGDGSSTRNFGGLGMGLALGRQMIERMGGRLEVISEPGTRTVFSIRLRAA